LQTYTVGESIHVSIAQQCNVLLADVMYENVIFKNRRNYF